jgi:hypothetical protein
MADTALHNERREKGHEFRQESKEHYQINREIEEILKSRDTNLPKLNASRHNPFFDLQPVHTTEALR